MTRCIRKRLIIIPCVLALCILCAGSKTQIFAVASQSVHADSASLHVISVRRSAGNRSRKSDYVGATMRVRLRFSAPAETSIYLYAPDECPPEGYILEKTGSQVVWWAYSKRTDTKTSPGFSSLRSQFGDGWIFLSAGSAIEWDIDTEETPLGTERARSVFVKQKKEASPTEVISDWFKASVNEIGGQPSSQ